MPNDTRRSPGTDAVVDGDESLEPASRTNGPRADKTTVLPFRKEPVTHGILPLEQLYSRFDQLAEGRDLADSHWDVHAEILDRLAANMREAGNRGWTSCAVERAGGMGRLRAFGVRRSESQRRLIPDWHFDSKE